MLALAPDLGRRVGSILCVGAHSDDIEIGCGGTLLTLLDDAPNVTVDWVVLSAEGARAEEAHRAAEKIAGAGDRVRVRVAAFPERFFPAAYADLKHWFDALGRDIRPDLVFAPRTADVHQDHRTTAELVWQTFRDQPVLEYEIVKYEGDLGQPNAYVALDDATAQRKLDLLSEVFATQRGRDWFDDSTFRAIMRLRGVECRAPSGYAEAFHASKLRLR